MYQIITDNTYSYRKRERKKKKLSARKVEDDPDQPRRYVAAFFVLDPATPTCTKYRGPLAHVCYTHTHTHCISCVRRQAYTRNTMSYIHWHELLLQKYRLMFVESVGGTRPKRHQAGGQSLAADWKHIMTSGRVWQAAMLHYVSRW